MGFCKLRHSTQTTLLFFILKERLVVTVVNFFASRELEQNMSSSCTDMIDAWTHDEFSHFQEVIPDALENVRHIYDTEDLHVLDCRVLEGRDWTWSFTRDAWKCIKSITAILLGTAFKVNL